MDVISYSKAAAAQKIAETANRQFNQESAPTTMSTGDTWYVPTTGISYKYVNDGTSDVWVDQSTAGAGVSQEYVDDADDLKANLADPTFTGTVTLPENTVVDLVSDTTPQLGGDLDTNAHQLQLSKGADVASATALPILTDGNYFDVTGTTTITSINTTGRVGTVIKLHFDDILTFTHNATDLVLPSGANITTAAGDEAELVEYASGDFRCTSYTKVDGTSVVSAGGGIGEFIDTSIAISSDDSALANDDGSDNNNIAMGVNAGADITTGYNNIVSGMDSGESITTGHSNVAMGTYAMKGSVAITAIANSAVGVFAGTAITSGDHNAMLGYQAGKKITSGTYNIALGSQALMGPFDGLTGSYNIGVGYQTGYNLTTGQYNVLSGYQAGINLTTGSSNIYIGRGQSGSALTGDDNIGIGNYALRGYNGGSGLTNIGIGRSAGSALTDGDNNTFIGTSAGNVITTGNNNTCIGNDADATSATVSNEITLGNSSVDRFRIPGLGIDLTGGIAWETISTTEVTESVSQVDVEHAFDDSYKAYKIVCSNMVVNGAIYAKVKVDGAYSDLSEYDTGYIKISSAAASGDLLTQDYSYFRFFDTAMSGGTGHLTLDIQQNNNSYIKLNADLSIQNGAGMYRAISSNMYTVAKDLQGIRIYPSTNTFESGTFVLMGLK